MIGQQKINDALKRWDQHRQQVKRYTLIPNESAQDRTERIAALERDPEAWFSYYFPAYYSSRPADFHRRASRRIIKHDKWYEVRAWSRELAKSTRSMMEVMYLLMTGRAHNMLLISHSNDNACELLMPYMINLESNTRLINDYGKQVGYRGWEVGKLVTATGKSLRAIGAGQSPRGTRNEEKRPDLIIIDDIDTDEKVRNVKRINDTWRWIEQAVIPTMSVSGSKRIIFLGNIIAKDCTVVRASKMADHAEIINIRDSHGRSSWPEKNSEQDIDYILSKISYISGQQEYYNNPIVEGSVFTEMHYKRMQPLKHYRFLVAYTDPSFKDSKKNDYKATVLCGMHKNELHIIKAYVKQTTTAEMAMWYKQIQDYVDGRVPVYYVIEANATQDLVLREVRQYIAEHKWEISLTPDQRKKPDKFSRIETALEPLNRENRLWLNVAEQDDPGMQTLKDQFLSLTPSLSAHDDGPDAVEGAYYHLRKRIVSDQPLEFGPARSQLKSNSTKHY